MRVAQSSLPEDREFPSAFAAQCKKWDGKTRKGMPITLETLMSEDPKTPLCRNITVRTIDMWQRMTMKEEDYRKVSARLKIVDWNHLPREVPMIAEAFFRYEPAPDIIDPDEHGYCCFNAGSVVYF
jgi:hypothetical protein